MKEATIYAAAVKWAEKNGITGGIAAAPFPKDRKQAGGTLSH